MLSVLLLLLTGILLMFAFMYMQLT